MVLVETGGKVLAQDFESHAPTSSGILTVSLLPSVCSSYEKLSIRKAYGRKEGNSKGAGGDGEQCS
jgi:hypothetical protein